MNDREDGAPATGPNQDLAAVHRGLIALVERLGRQMDDCTTVAQVDALAMQIQQTTARVTAVGSVLLVAQTSEIARLAATVTAAFPDLEQAISDRESAEWAVASFTNMIHLVDETVSVARMIC